MLQLWLPLAGELSLALQLAALASTHLAHVSVWAAAAMVLTRYRRLPASANASIWKLALFGPLLTTAVSALLRAIGQHGTAPSGALAPSLHSAAWSALPNTAASGAREAANAYWLSGPFWQCLAFAGAAALLLGLVRFTRAACCMSRTLRGRLASGDERSKRLLRGLSSRASLKHVRLTESNRITAPLSIGLAEICVPVRLLGGMNDAEVEAVLAHELAHLERRDGVWFPAVAFVEAVSWVNPLTRWVASRARYCAELACDDRAVALTERPRALAQALAHVAERVLESRRGALLPSMGESSGALLTRVRRLVRIEASGASRHATKRARWAIAFVAVAGCSSSALSLELPQAADSAHTLQALANPVLELPRVSSARVAERAALAEELAALARREQQVKDELDGLASQAAISSSEAPPPRLKELEQELRHSLQMRAFLEARLREQPARHEDHASP